MDVEIYDMTIVPIIIGLVQLFKMSGLKKKYAPFVALGLGILFSIIYFDQTMKDKILLGLIFGLSASGLYSGSKNFFENKRS